MQGRVLQLDARDAAGLIRADDGGDLPFSFADALSVQGLVLDARVDFLERAGRAVQIVVLAPGRTSSVQPPIHQAAASDRRAGAPAETLWGYFHKAVRHRYVDFRGRARRKEYWAFILFAWIIVGPPLLVGLLLDPGQDLAPAVSSASGARVAYIVAGLLTLALALPNVAVAVRRMHDTGRTGWAVLITFLPYVGGLIFILLTCLPSQRGRNAFGAEPQR